MVTDQTKYLPLSRKILVGILVISACLTFIITALQVILDYRADLSDVDRRLEQIERSYLNSIAESLWSLNDSQIKTNLEGIMYFPDVVLVQIVENGNVTYQVGTKAQGHAKSRIFDITYKASDKPEKIGELHIDASLARIEDRLIHKIFFILFSQSLKTFVASLLILLLIRNLVIRHLHTIKNFLEGYSPHKSRGVLSLRRRKGKSKYVDDIDSLEYSINKMVGDLDFLYENLERQVKERTKQLETKTREIDSMLKSMKQGVFTFGQEGRVSREYSAYLENIFEQKDLAGADVFSLLFGNSNISSDIRSRVTNAVEMEIGENRMQHALNAHVYPKEILKRISDQEKILEVDWEPILVDDAIDKIMVIARDVTDLRKLQREAEQHRFELTMIDQILKAGVNYMMTFIRSTADHLEVSRKILGDLQKSDREKARVICGGLHTIKGNARSLGLLGVSDCVHDAETYFSVYLQDGEHLPINPGRAQQELELVAESISAYALIIDEKLRPRTSSVDGDAHFLAEFDAAMPVLREPVGLAAEPVLKRLIRLRINSKTESIQAVLQPSLISLPELAEQLGKPAPVVTFAENRVRFNREHAGLLVDIFNHLFRNAMDHGIEPVEVRREAQKPEVGTIIIVVQRDTIKITIHFFDDGAGLYLPGLLAKGMATGLLSADASDDEIAEVVFHSGLSTSRAVSTISGRGIGMDVVRSVLSLNQGTVRIEFTERKSASGYRPFRFSISLPALFGVQVESY